MKSAGSWVACVLVVVAIGGAGCSQKPPDRPAPELIDALKDKDEAIRIRAAADLGRAGADQAANAVRALTDALGDESPYVRQAAVKSLGAHGANARKALPALEKVQKDPDEGVRLAVQDALKKIQGH